MPTYRCPYCGRDNFRRQVEAVAHIRECYNLKHAATGEPVTAWKLTSDDKKFLKTNRITADEPTDGRKDT